MNPTQQANKYYKQTKTLISNQNKGYKNLLSKQNATQDALFGRLQGEMGAQEKLPDLYTRLSGDLGINDLNATAQTFKNEIYNTKGLLDSLEGDINTRTAGTFTNEAQRNRQLAFERNPLVTELGRLGTGLQPVADMLGSAQGQLQTLLPLYQQQQERELEPTKMRINAQNDRFAREISGYDTNRQNQLNSLLDKVSRGFALSDREWQAAQDLAASERDYANKLGLMREQNKLDQQSGLKLAKLNEKAQSKALKAEKKALRAVGIKGLQDEGVALREQNAEATPYQGNILDYLGRRGPLALTDLLGLSSPF